jgi:hypothetical protein
MALLPECVESDASMDKGFPGRSSEWEILE